MISSHVLPAGTCPGQRTMHGTRIPPSNVLPFFARSGRPKASHAEALPSEGTAVRTTPKNRHSLP